MTKKTTKKTTKRVFQQFKKEVLRLLDKFRIDDWKVYFLFDYIGDDCNARCITDCVSRNVTFAYNTETDTEDEDDILQIALHEVCHLLTADIAGLAYSRFVTSDEVRKASEMVTRKIQFLLQDKARRH